MKAALTWFFGIGGDAKKLAWLQKLQSEGHRVPMLEKAPKMDIFETAVIKAAYNCKSVTDINIWGFHNGIQDLPEFIDLVLYCRNRIEENART